MLAAAALMFAACAQFDTVNEVPESEPQAIGFETFSKKITRAEISDEEALKSVGFNVWGYKAATADPMDWDDQYTVFNNVEVTFQGGKWGYVDKQYWDRTSTYKFYAVAPNQPTGVTYSINAGTGMITIDGVESAKSSASNDFLIDRDGNIGVDGNYAGTDHNPVDLNFHHVMSKVSFKLKAAVPEAITINSLTMSGWNNNKGTFVQTKTETPAAATDITEWTITAGTAGSVVLVGAGAGDADGAITLNADMTTTANVKDTYIMVPQSIDENTLTFTISFTIDGEKFVNQVGKLSTEQIWGTDAHTIYTISVGPDVIDFNVTNVCDFDAGPDVEPGIEIE